MRSLSAGRWTRTLIVAALALALGFFAGAQLSRAPSLFEAALDIARHDNHPERPAAIRVLAASEIASFFEHESELIGCASTKAGRLALRQALEERTESQSDARLESLVRLIERVAPTESRGGSSAGQMSERIRPLLERIDSASSYNPNSAALRELVMLGPGAANELLYRVQHADGAHPTQGDLAAADAVGEWISEPSDPVIRQLARDGNALAVRVLRRRHGDAAAGTAVELARRGVLTSDTAITLLTLMDRRRVVDALNGYLMNSDLEFGRIAIGLLADEAERRVASSIIETRVEVDKSLGGGTRARALAVLACLGSRDHLDVLVHGIVDCDVRESERLDGALPALRTALDIERFSGVEALGPSRAIIDRCRLWVRCGAPATYEQSRLIWIPSE